MPCHGMSFAATDFKEDNQAVTCDSDLSNAELQKGSDLNQVA